MAQAPKRSRQASKAKRTSHKKHSKKESQAGRPQKEENKQHTKIIVCPRCGETVKLIVHYTSDTRTHLYACLLCPLMMCWWPYTNTSLKQPLYYCPECGALVILNEGESM